MKAERELTMNKKFVCYLIKLYAGYYNNLLSLLLRSAICGMAKNVHSSFYAASISSLYFNPLCIPRQFACLLFSHFVFILYLCYMLVLFVILCFKASLNAYIGNARSRIEAVNLCGDYSFQLEPPVQALSKPHYYTDKGLTI